MKKLTALIAVICLAFSFAVACQARNAQPAAPDTDSDTGTLDYEAIRALHNDGDIVATINGRDVSWAEYYAWFYMSARQVENYFGSMSMYYGISETWTDTMSGDSNETYADFVVENTENTLRQFAAIDSFTETNGLKLDETVLKESFDQQKAKDIANLCGEGGTDAQLVEKLGEMNMTMDSYERMTMANVKYKENFKAMYGNDAELVSDDDALSYLADNGYVSAGHILFMTMDPATGEELDEAAQAEKKAQAYRIYEELSAITDQDELLRRFAELKKEYCEDSGKTSYPDGYTYTPGTMVAEFEDAVNSLEPYGLSEPVKSSFGYHVILRLPPDPDRVISYSQQNTPLTARNNFANADYAARMEQCLENAVFEYAPGFEPVSIADFVK